MGSLVTYLSVFFLLTLCLNEGRKKCHMINLWSLIGLSILVVFAAGRYHVGTDYNTYIHMFERYEQQSWFQVLQGGEILFCAIAKICYTAGGRVLTWGVFAAMTVIPIYSTIHRYFPEIHGFAAFFAFISLYYAFSFNITRQFIAIAFVVWGMKYVFENKFIPFLLIIVFATGFHLSAPVAVLLWFLWDHKRNKPINGQKRVILLIAITFIIFGYQEIIVYITSHVSGLENYASYAEISARGQNRDLYLHIAELVVLLFLKGKMKVDDERVEVMYSLLIISVLIGFTGFTHPQVKRLAYYYAVPAKIILFGYLPYCFTENSKKLAVALVCIYTAAYFTLTAYILGEANLIPYRFNLFSAW